MSILDKWINPYYLTDEAVDNIRESVLAKPNIKYVVLDNFFVTSELDKLIENHDNLKFSEKMDKYTSDNKLLPYDSSVHFAKADDYGSELFFDSEWHRYCAYLTHTDLNKITTEVKLRHHKPYSDGFWIHTDSVIRSMVIIAYFNKGWRTIDGGLLQLWRIDEAYYNDSYNVDDPTGRMDFLVTQNRISTITPGGGFNDNQRHDLVLIDQIVPSYNRVFMCNFKHSPAYHSITPSNNRARLGFVQWLSERK